MALSKYVPRPTGLDLEFNRLAVASGRVHVQRCDDCNNHQHPPRAFCARCGGEQLEFVPTGNQGFVYSWVVSHFTVDSGWADDVPYTTVIVELPEGPRVVGSWSGDRADLRIGLPVTVRPEPRSEDFAFLHVEG